jgi:hypothetical protein
MQGYATPLTFNQRVVGSIPTALTNKLNSLARIDNKKNEIRFTSGQQIGQQSRILITRPGFRSMKCPHCGIDFHENWVTGAMLRDGFPVFGKIRDTDVSWEYATTQCSKCRDVTIQIAAFASDTRVNWVKWRMVYPVGAKRGPVPKEVPDAIAIDYIEACNVLPISAKASAALSRRCLQNNSSSGRLQGARFVSGD